MVCLRGTYYVLMMNGRLQGGFQGVKGLRQGDPISPLLFVLVMEYLTHLLQLGATQSKFKFHPLCKSLKIINLCFADDLIIFCKANRDSIQCVKQIFEDFCSSTGLKANHSKSHVYFGGIPNLEKGHLLQILQIKEGTFPLNYLGVPMRPTKWKVADCDVILKNIKLRLHTWASRHLSYAGRTQLINSVLLGLCNYWMNIFMLPQSVIKEIDKLCMWFLWGNNGTRSNFHRASWSKVSLPKAYGGLGFGEGTKWNKAMLAKYIWAISHQPEAMWVKWINAVYLRGQNFWNYQLKADSSWYWCKLCHIRDAFTEVGIDAVASHGYFKIGLFYKRIIHQEQIKYHHFVWNRMSVPKHRFIIWQVVNDNLLTRDHLQKVLQHLDSSLCPVCCQLEESHEHLFFHYKCSQQVTHIIQTWIGCKWPLRLKDWTCWIEDRRKGVKSEVMAAVFSATIYHVWQNRNSCILNGYSFRVNVIVDMIKRDIVHRVSFFSQKKMTANERLFVRNLCSL
ncbi:uncharacterized protein LOC133779733 [Humulus lupulus]|uniref:uncharacterized protein LOC133779733 n=1 Tax=Humulus lupulus TaxID=3486 RepID=UPI002B415342|nr:uncharacterized protein LOC133779733 [Humulus lupulus]